MIKKLTVVFAAAMLFAFMCGVAPVSAKTTRGHETPAKIVTVTKPVTSVKHATHKHTTAHHAVTSKVMHASDLSAPAICYSHVGSSSSDQVSTTLPNGLIDISNYGTFYIGEQQDAHQFNLEYCDGSGIPTGYTLTFSTPDPTMEKYIQEGCTSMTVGVNSSAYSCSRNDDLLVLVTNASAMHADGVAHPQQIPVTMTIQGNLPGAPVQTVNYTLYYYYQWS